MKGFYKLNTNNIPKMRTVRGAIAEIKAYDPNTDITERKLRRMIGNGELPTIRIDNTILLNYDLLLERLSCYNDNATGA